MQMQIGVLLKRLGERLKFHREKTGMSQESFAIRCGLHRTAVGLLERGGRIPRLDTLLILAQELRVPLGELLRGIEKWGLMRKALRKR